MTSAMKSHILVEKGEDAVKRNRFWRVALPIGIALWTAFVWSRSLMSAAASAADSSRVAALLMNLFGWETQPEWLIFAIRKTAHFAEFAILGLLWASCSRTYSRRWLWLCGLPVGAIDECLQFLAPGRAPMLMDVGIDTAGLLCGVATVWFFVWIGRKKIK